MSLQQQWLHALGLSQQSNMGLEMQWASNSSWEAIVNWWLLVEGKSDFFNGIVPGKLETLEWMVAHPFVHRQHKLDPMSYFLKTENIIGNLEGVRDRDVKLLLTQLKVHRCCIFQLCLIAFDVWFRFYIISAIWYVKKYTEKLSF